MKPSLQAGLAYEFKFRVPETKTVPQLFPEAPEFQQMPEVFATGFMVGLCEWACIQAVNPHLDWPSEQTVGTHVNLSHPAGLDCSRQGQVGKHRRAQAHFPRRGRRWHRQDHRGHA